MSNLVIVAIPREEDPVWKYSSEKVPHCTLLFLGENTDKVSDVAAFLEHAVKILDRGPFGLTVDHRGTLGADEADVLFFREDWSTKELAKFRGQLLKNTVIRNAYDSVEQFPGWSPHLTMGYPSTPAKKDERDYPGFHWVEFDRIALWTGNYEGPEFRLEYNYDQPLEVMMNATEAGQKAIEDLLHSGVKGMKWGVRKDRSLGPATVTSRTNAGLRGRTRVKATGGKGEHAHEDAVKVAGKKAILKRSGTHALSNKDLQEVIDRTRLEDQAKQAIASKGGKFVKKKLGTQLDQQSQQFVREQIRKKQAGR